MLVFTLINSRDLLQREFTKKLPTDQQKILPEYFLVAGREGQLSLVEFEKFTLSTFVKNPPIMSPFFR